MNFFLNTKIFESGKDWEPADKADFEGVLRNFIQILESLLFFPNSVVYYSSSEIETFLTHVDLIVDVYEYEFYELTYLRNLIMNLQGKDWPNHKFHKDDHDYLLQLNGGYTPYSVSNTTIAESTEYKHEYNDATVINIYGLVPGLLEIVDVYRRSLVPPFDSGLIKLSVLLSKGSIIKHVLTNRLPIVFNLNPKHGENRSNAVEENGKTISPLKCSRQEASVFLTKAIGFKSYKELYFYDVVRNEFIEFKPENTPDNSYHGYYPYNQEDIPEDVRSFLRDNILLFET